MNTVLYTIISVINRKKIKDSSAPAGVGGGNGEKDLVAKRDMFERNMG